MVETPSERGIFWKILNSDFVHKIEKLDSPRTFLEGWLHHPIPCHHFLPQNCRFLKMPNEICVVRKWARLFMIYLHTIAKKSAKHWGLMLRKWVNMWKKISPNYLCNLTVKWLVIKNLDLEPWETVNLRLKLITGNSMMMIVFKKKWRVSDCHSPTTTTIKITKQLIL